MSANAGAAYLKTIARAIDDVAATVARMREFYRGREPQLALMPVQLNPLVQQVVELTRARWSDMPQQRGAVIRVDTDLAPDLPGTLGVESEVREALINLVFNAVDAMPEGGLLTLRTRSTGPQGRGKGAAPRRALVEVIDTGVGMDDDTRRRCLEPFFTTKGERGTGLGLAMVYGVAQRHGAEVEIDSAVGRGTTVRLSFPIPASAPALSAMAAAPQAPTSRLRILIVDDDPLMLKSLCDTLELDGHVVVTANGGQAGIDAFRAARVPAEAFDVVITDLGMPHVDGRKVARAVKEIGPATPVIMLTGWGQRLVADGEVPAHVDRVLNKPPRLEEVRAALAQATHRGRAAVSESTMWNDAMTQGIKGRLLIVDDEQPQMRALCDTLGAHGYETVGFTSGEAALSALRQAPFDLLLADLMMPGMNGIALLRAALQIDPTMVGIIMTGEGTIGTAVEAMQSGALDYILKPFKLSDIFPVLGRGLEMRRLRLENAVLEQRVREHAAELESANRELDAFTRSASHDLRSPLHIVMGLSSLLVRALGPQLSAEHHDWLVQIERSARHMYQLIDALMRLSLLGRQALNLKTVNVAALVRGVVDDLRREHPQRRVMLQIGELPEAAADESLLRQVFVNLLSNAFKFTRDTEQAVIQVRCESRGEQPTFVVRDNGLGFDMTRAERLFDAFQRLHRADAFEGSGVGLSIVQRIIQRHGGRIWAEALPGQGASFFFTLGGAAEPVPASASSG